MRRLWIVRAGKEGRRELDAIEQGKLFPGFLEVGDLSTRKDRNAILDHLREVMPDDKEKRLGNFATQLNQFANEIQIDDLVVTPRKVTDGLAIGTVISDYGFDPDSPYKHFRSVEWREESLPRDKFKQDMKNSFGANMTICEVERNNARERVEKVLETGTDPGPMMGNQGVVLSEPVEDNAEIEDYPTNIEEVADQQIISLVKSEFAGHALTDLVAEILHVEGYITKVSPPGPDGGVDILATGGTLGLGEERICVQVKSGDGQANQNVVLHLLGAVSDTHAQTGLLVSIGGVNKAARKKLDDNFFKLRLWQTPDLLKALFRTYAELSDTTRAKLPLKQIWAPVSGDDA